MLKRSKKGFTLAELLIVVAIIAVLVAIAVPLFVSSLTKAQDATKNANIAAVREAGVVAILSAETPSSDASAEGASDTNKIYTAKDGKWVLEGPWLVKGVIENGKLSTVTIEAVAPTSTKVDGTTIKEYTEASGTITIYVEITRTTLPGA